jgi:hypothetical protein
MTEFPIGLGGGMNPCFVFNLRFIDCQKREAYSTLLCKDQWEDYQECKFGTRHVYILLLIIENLSTVVST